MSDWNPSHPLPDAYMEIAALHHAMGSSRREAFKQVKGLTPGRDVREQASLSWECQEFSQRVDYLRQQIRLDAGYSIQDWAEAVAAIASSDITDVLEWGVRPNCQGMALIQDPEDQKWYDANTGEEVSQEQLTNAEPEPFVNVRASASLPRRVTAAIKRLKVNKDGQIELELHDKMAALKAMRDHFREIDEVKPPTVEGQVAKIDREGLPYTTTQELVTLRNKLRNGHDDITEGE